MKSERQYIELYNEVNQLIKQKSCEPMNAVRDAAFQVFRVQGFPTQKLERYKYTDVPTAFAPNYGISINSAAINPSQYIYSISAAPIDIRPYYNKIADAAD